MANTTKTIKGQAAIISDALVQDQILLYTLDGKTIKSTQGMVTLIPNIWDDLKSKTGEVKTNGRGYWYWEVSITDTSGERSDITVFFECPAPEVEMFLTEDGKNYDFTEKEADSDWTKYWKKRMKLATDSLFNSENAVINKEAVLKGANYVDQTGSTVVLPDMEVTKSDGLSDISNLLNGMY